MKTVYEESLNDTKNPIIVLEAEERAPRFSKLSPEQLKAVEERAYKKYAKINGGVTEKNIRATIFQS